ncbi:hypothetical protein KFL_002880180 [Klebsormidium nitens]|uniref:Uncharacterized protein n=1 Tax=Klebsormidium nitens TaxID=105231 RepID=A0A0U9HKB8_KLENI|nr:hypothetical protein KFL_002880180 [Klebsormidium nitens]|eukprot:GAQ86433.1 hypothetical protein KFL_002880180 [Klebsormidium nitens]
MLDFLTNACQGRGLSNSDIDWLLGIIFHPDFDRTELRFRNAKEFRKFQDGLQAIQNAMAAMELDGLVPDEKERIDGVVAAVAMYSDPTAVSGDMSVTGWPVTLTIRNIGSSVQHRGEYAVLVGVVSQLQELPEFGFIASSRAFKERRSTLLWQCETQILALLKAASSRGVFMRDPWGVLRKVYPGLYSYSCDLQEAYKLGVVKSGRCLDCLVPPSELNDLEGRWPERSEAFMGRVVAACTAALEEREPGVGCLWNWYEGLDLPEDVRDSYRALVPDPLHGIYLGIWLYLVDGIRDWAKRRYSSQLAAKKVRTIDARLRGMPRESGFRLPRRKGVYMEKKKTFKAYEQRNMMQWKRLHLI